MTTAPDVGEDYESLLEFLYVCPVGIAQLDASGAVEMMNPAGARLLMQVSGQPQLDNFYSALGPAGSALQKLGDGLTADQGTICEGHRLTFEVARRALPLSVNITLIKLSRTRVMAVIADESQLVEQQRVARSAEQRISAVVDGVRDYAIFSLDRDHLVETWNRSAERLFGYSAAEMIGTSYLRLFPRDASSEARHETVMAHAVETGWGEDEGWWSRKQTTRFWGSSVVSVIEEPDGGRGGFVVVTRDLTRKKREEDDLRNAATTDFLTGLLNRRAFEDAARLEMSRWQRCREPLSVLIVDADHFKHVNDTYGHATGDDVLRAVAHCMRQQLRELDVVARLGGEEFVIMMPSTDVVGARAVAERIRQSVEALRVPTAESGAVRVTVSVGVAQTDRDATSTELLLQRADAALYEAKRRGRNRTVVGHGSSEPSAA